MIHGFIKKRCPKCGGNVCVDSDCYLEGGFMSWAEQASCLQCGYIIYGFEQLSGSDKKSHTLSEVAS
ncbi:MAG: hypothetical protein V1767_00290 [Chloroflexota bacterium]